MATMATGITSKATGQWDKLENIFEERVAKALNKLGVPSSKDVEALIARIDELTKSVQKLSAKSASVPPAPAPKAAAPKAPRKSAAKPTVKRSAARKPAPPAKTEPTEA